MDLFSKIAAILFGLYIMWMLYRYISANPESLSLPNINKSMYTMALLAIGLIIFIGLVVYMLRS